jgi:hypothetical protein
MAGSGEQRELWIARLPLSMRPRLAGAPVPVRIGVNLLLVGSAVAIQLAGLIYLDLLHLPRVAEDIVIVYSLIGWIWIAGPSVRELYRDVRGWTAKVRARFGG